jgi:uncharacterized protein with von Willebrand factor type A (vWA) domain
VFGGTVDPAEWRGRDGRDASVLPPGAARPANPDRPATPAGPGTRRRTLVVPAGGDTGPGGPDGPNGSDALLAAASAEERLRTQDFAAWTEAELCRLRALVEAMAVTAPPRRARRKVTGAGGRQIDLRATLRRSRRTGGDPARLIRRRRRDRPRRLVLLCDISGSMQAYARAYLQLLLSGVGGARAEAFVFATRLTRLTPVLRAAAPDVALARAARAAPDWSGGTRIGEAIKAFNDRYGRRGMARGAVVIILSDGWDCGDPAVLSGEMAKLRRLAYRVIWVNPRQANVQYQPLTSGMTAALPHVDAARSGHSLAALEELLTEIRADRWIAGAGGPGWPVR